MSDDFMRLSDLIPAYIRHFKTSSSEAGHALHELIEELHIEYAEKQWKPNSINEYFWVGRASSPKRATRHHGLYFQTLSEYFSNFYDLSSGKDQSLVECIVEGDAGFTYIPASVIYFSRSALQEWILDAGIEFPVFIFNGCVEKKADKGGEGGLMQIELGSVSKILNGLVEIIKEVDKAYRDVPADYEGKKRADRIKSHAYRLRNPPRKNANECTALIAFAEEVGVKFVLDRTTLARYMNGESRTGGEE